jgi:hypothetical protein
MTGYEQFKSGAAAPSQLALLADLAGALNAAELEAAKLTEQLAAAQAKVTDLAERQIPELMDGLGLKTFTTKAGFRVDVKRTIRASIPAARKDEAMRWLDDNGHSGLIKRSVLVAFDREQEKDARKLEQQLGKKFENVKTELKVESSTLRAFIGEQLAAGAAVPLELFGAWEQRIAKITATE